MTFFWRYYETILGRKIFSEKTLIFFDEIQASPRAITSLKYLCEKAPTYHVVAAGSLLGVSVGKPSSFPVGKVNFIMMFPMSFFEFLIAVDEEILLRQLVEKRNCMPVPEAIHRKLLRLYKYYLYLGGMPEVIQHYKINTDIKAARQIQKEILKAYERDFSKYSSAREAIMISEIWNSIPTQLARENKKFRYSEVKKGGRASRFESAIEWLRKVGLIYLSHNLKIPKPPLKGYADLSKFKVFMLDTGLLGAMLDVHSRIILSPDLIFSQYNGAFIENYVAVELVHKGIEHLFYWVSKSEAEVDFIIGYEGNILPLEVKSGLSRKTKSLRVYSQKYHPSHVYRTSPRNFTKDNDLVNIPLYAVSLLPGDVGSGLLL
ncbi:MAG: ATP-binding protein [bacterium]